MGSPDVEERLRRIAEELLELAREHDCDIMCVKVNRNHQFVSAYAFSGDTRVASIIDWTVGGDG